MYELKIRDYCFIAHSLKDEFFGPAKNLHGVTYVVDLLISSKELIEKNVIIDIGLANKILKSVISQYNYKVMVKCPSIYLSVLVNRGTMQGMVVMDYAKDYKKAADYFSKALEIDVPGLI